MLRARDDRELVSVAQEHYPDLVLLDEDFVGDPTAADSIITRLRERPISRRIPIALLCSVVHDPPPGGCLLAVKKPVGGDAFVRAVEEALGITDRSQLTLRANLVSNAR